jgi:hypothetical protein
VTDHIHTCSYYCDRPECIKRQRDELRDMLEIDAAMIERGARAVASAESWDGWDDDSSWSPNGNTPEEQRGWCRDVATIVLTAALTPK